MTKVRASVIGATGYVGAELVRLLSRHPGVRLGVLTSESHAGQRVGEVYPHLEGYAGDAGNVSGATTPTYVQADVDAIAEVSDAVLLALPHGHAMDLAPALLEHGLKVIDLGADYRLADSKVYEEWYGQAHRSPALLDEAVYGLPELHRDRMVHARLVACPGCYPTATALAVVPLLAAELMEPGSLIVDAKSGVSGAGRGLALGVHYAEVNENLKAYNIAGAHRHTPEIEQELSAWAGRPLKITFTPHLVPMTRGILATVYADLRPGVEEEDIMDAYRRFYDREHFVNVLGPGRLPQTKEVYGSNHCRIGFAVDRRSGRVVAVSVIDNLVKGAAGQAVQVLNVLSGLPEPSGLDFPGIYP